MAVIVIVYGRQGGLVVLWEQLGGCEHGKVLLLMFFHGGCGERLGIEGEAIGGEGFVGQPSLNILLGSHFFFLLSDSDDLAELPEEVFCTDVLEGRTGLLLALGSEGFWLFPILDGSVDGGREEGGQIEHYSYYNPI